MIWAKNIFENMCHYSEIKIQSFRKQLWKKASSMHKFQKFFCVVDRHEQTEFLVFWLFWLLRSFFDQFFMKSWIKKWPEPKKLLKWKIIFFMPVNLAKKFLNFVHAGTFFSWLISETLNFYFRIMAPFVKSFFWLKSLLMSSTLTG